MEKRYRLIWGVTLIIIGIGTLINAGSNIIGADLPDAARRIIGVIDLIALPVLVFTSVKTIKK